MATRKPKLTPAQVGERLGIAYGKAIGATGTGDLIFRGNHYDRIRPANKRLAKFSAADRRIAQRAMDRTVSRIKREVIDRATSRQFERDYGRPPTPPKAPKATKARKAPAPRKAASPRRRSMLKVYEVPGVRLPPIGMDGTSPMRDIKNYIRRAKRLGMDPTKSGQKPKSLAVRLGQEYARLYATGLKAEKTGGIGYYGGGERKMDAIDKRIRKLSPKEQAIAQRAGQRAHDQITLRLSKEAGKLKAAAGKATKPRTVSVRAKPKTAGLTGAKSKGGGKLRSDAQLAKEFDALYGKAKSLPKGSKARATAQREVTKRMVAYNRKAKADGSAGSYTMTKLGSKTARELSRLADKLYAEARATTGKKAKAALGRKALAVMKAYNAKVRASGKGGERYDLTLNRQRAGVSDG